MIVFEFERRPNEPQKKDVALAVIVLVDKYRGAKGIKPDKQLQHKDVDEILGGVKSLIYELEELKPLKNEK